MEENHVLLLRPQNPDLAALHHTPRSPLHHFLLFNVYFFFHIRPFILPTMINLIQFTNTYRIIINDFIYIQRSNGFS